MDRHPKLEGAFASIPDQYPAQLAARYPRVFAEIVKRWETTELDEYFPQLLLQDRSDRQGFPPEVLKDIFALYNVHESWKAHCANKQDLWADERLQREFSDHHLEFSPGGFFRALELGDESAVRRFIEAGVDLEVKNSVGWTPLMVSAFMGSERQAELLIRAGARMDARDPRGYGPLHWAALKGYEPVVDLLLQKGAFANIKSHKGITPLLQAASCGHLAIVELLLKKRAHVNEPDTEGWTPLHKAVANGHAEVAELLLSAGGDMNAQHASGETPITIARRRKYERILAILEKAETQ